MSVTTITGNDGANTLQGGAGDDLIYGFDPNGPQGDVSSITATRLTVSTQLRLPLFVTAPPGDLDRLFIVEKTGRIKIMDLNTGQLLANPFLDVSGEINAEGERGLLGLAFDPDFATNGFFYVNLINAAADTEIRRYHVSPTDANRADAASAQLVITVDQPGPYINHKAGWLGFGPDGYLYASLGDGGPGGTIPQDVNLLLGKMLRLDVDVDAFPADPNRNYGIPSDNPFVASAPLDEIWAIGLRNPWRPSFDRALGDLYIADVGQAKFEEVNIGAAGANYGWSLYEGSEGAGAPSAGTLTFPVYSYPHVSGSGASITGGYVYRGESEGLQGKYFFADYVTEKIFTLSFDGTSWVATERTTQIVPSAGAIDNPASFGEDGRGNLYIVDINGEVFRLNPVVTSADIGDTLRGDAGNDRLYGGSGNDTLQGGAGLDIIYGGLGDDTANGGADADTLLGGPGNDVLIGGDGNDVLVGDAGVNPLIGGTGDDVLDSRGGGPSQLQGGTGNDVYRVGNVGDSLIEFANEGTDEVQTALAAYTLRENLENLTYKGTGTFYGKGNALDNAIRGGTANDILSGLGGNDTLVGGGGRDYLVGGAGDDTLDGMGGTGSQLQGGAGDDTYRVSNARDTLVEFPGEGTDEVQTALASYALRDNLENLTYTGTGSFTGTGNSGVNVIRGGGGTDVLDALGGADTLQGLAGDDVLKFDAADASVDGGAGEDTLRFTGAGEFLDLTLPGADRFVSLEIVDLTSSGNNTLTLSAAGVTALSSTGTLRVDGDGGDFVTASDALGWSRGPDQTIGANLYRTFTQNAATLLIDSDVSTNLALV